MVYKHPTALVETNAVGSGSRIWAFAHVMTGAQIGTDCNIGDHAFIEGGVVIGNRVTVKNLVMLWDGVTIQDDVFIGPGVVFTNDRRPRSPRASSAENRYSDRSWLSETTIEQGASVGANATIMSGIRVGRYAMIGAGAVVTKDVPAHALVLGVPAKQVGWVSVTGSTLTFEGDIAQCPDTGEIWKLVSNTIVRIAEP